MISRGIKIILGLAVVITLLLILDGGGFGLSIGQVKNQDVLVRNLMRTQNSEVKVLEKENRAELKALKAAQDLREKEWKKSEDQARHLFFETHVKGAERRVYIQDFLSRREKFRKDLNDEWTRRKQELSSKVNTIRVNQSKKLKELKECKPPECQP